VDGVCFTFLFCRLDDLLLQKVAENIFLLRVCEMKQMRVTSVGAEFAIDGSLAFEL